MPKGVFPRKPMSEYHKKMISLATLGKKKSLETRKKNECSR